MANKNGSKPMTLYVPTIYLLLNTTVSLGLLLK